jgi:hypothetical protein
MKTIFKIFPLLFGFFFLSKEYTTLTVQEEWLSNLEKLNQEIIHLKVAKEKTRTPCEKKLHKSFED